jgi:site-specific recombinase XerD
VPVVRLSALFEEFCQYLAVEKEATARSIATYRWCFGDFAEYARQDVGGTVVVQHFTVDRCRGYQYSLAARQLQPNTIRVRLATLASFAKWAVRRERIDKNPVGCGVELLRRSGGDLRAVQEHLRHADIQTTTVYTLLTHADLQKVVSTFDRNGS